MAQLELSKHVKSYARFSFTIAAPVALTVF